jgi:hypothetical protein
MAGGVFPDQPLALNAKCVVFSLLIASGYWYLPQKSLPVLVALLYFPYLALAWYDYVYQCKYKLKPTIFPLGRWLYLPFKPKEYKDSYENLSQESKQTIAKWDKFFILIILGTLITYASSLLVRR